MRNAVVFVLSISLACSFPVYAAPTTPQVTVSPGGPMDENSPLLLFVAVYVNAEAQRSKTTSWFTKWRVHRYAYNLAYRQSLDSGFSRSGARKYAAALVDDGPTPRLTCSDYAEPVQGCQP